MEHSRPTSSSSSPSTPLVPPSADTIDRYLAGELSAAERDRVEQQLAVDPIGAAFVRAAVSPDRARDVMLSDAVWSRLAPRLGLDTASDATIRPGSIVGSGRTVAGQANGRVSDLFSSVIRRTSLGLGTWALRYGFAAALLAAVVGLGVWLALSDRAGARAGTWAYRTAPGQRSTVRLGDGSTMMLGPATTVATTAHGMTVTGEAYFTVTPRSARPFVVRTSNALVQVLGTRFSVRQYPGEGRSRVVVEEGRVALSPVRSSRPGGAPTIVSAQMLAFVSDSSVIVTSEIPTREYTSWTHGTLVFEGVPLRVVVPELARAYGMDIRISDSTLAQRIVRTEVSVSSDPLHVVLDMLCRVLDAHLLREGRSYVLSPGRTAVKSLPAAPSRRLSPQPEQQYGR